MNWRGRPLTSHEVVVNLIGATTNSKGLKVRAHRDTDTYPLGIQISKAELAAVPVTHTISTATGTTRSIPPRRPD